MDYPAFMETRLWAALAVPLAVVVVCGIEHAFRVWFGGKR